MLTDSYTFVAVRKSHDHKVQAVFGPFAAVEDAAQYANQRQAKKRKDDYWIVSTLTLPQSLSPKERRE